MANMLKVSLALSDKVRARLDAVEQKLGFKDSDVVGVALQVYLLLQAEADRGYRTYLRGPGGEAEVHLGKRVVPVGKQPKPPNIQPISQGRQDKLNEVLGTEEPRTFEIWAEGFQATGGESVPACRVGSAEGRTFREAVLTWYGDHPSTVFDRELLMHGSCRLFPTEAEARRAFG